MTNAKRAEQNLVDACFNRAIADGRLSGSIADANFAGNYMYMGTYGGKDQFKRIDNRRYID